MNTPAHAIVNLLFAGRKRELLLPVLIGAVLPDAAMLLFYGWQKLNGQAESLIWSELYFDPAWQAFFDLFNSLPIILVAALLAWQIRSGFLVALLLSMALHAVFDLPLHNDDAHRHFYPLSEWRFFSPLSYWDPQRFGRWISAGEGLLVFFGGAYLCWLHRDWRARATVAAIVLVYAAYWAFVVLVWIN